MAGASNDARVVAVVLAAGASQRMGFPKQLWRWRGRALVSHVVDLATQAGAIMTVVVEGAYPLPDDVLGDATRVINWLWQDGPLGSLQCGLKAVLPSSPTGILVLTVDRPHLATETVQAVCRAHAQHQEAIWQPSYGQRRGHPVLWPVDLAVRLCQLPSTSNPRELLREPSNAVRRASVDVDDPAVLDNIDSPGDLALLTQVGNRV